MSFLKNFNQNFSSISISYGIFFEFVFMSSSYQEIKSHEEWDGNLIVTRKFKL